MADSGFAARPPVLSDRRTAPRIVIDTNTVLDWLAFRDAGVGRLVAAVASGDVHWTVCARMRDEFERTLAYPALARWAPDSAHLLAMFDQHALMQPDPATLPGLRCSDPDDQVFLDLAVAVGARWLVSHDRALLRLARRAQVLGLRIVDPAGWFLLPDPA